MLNVRKLRIGILPEKNMQKTSQNNQTALDKTSNLVYNTGMRNKKTLTKENEMTFTKYNTNVNHLTTHELVASRIEKGLTNELQIICKVGNILRDMGKSNTQINFLMNVDEDFLSEVVSCYKG